MFQLTLQLLVKAHYLQLQKRALSLSLRGGAVVNTLTFSSFTNDGFVKVNSTTVNSGYSLQNGDIVEIYTTTGDFTMAKINGTSVGTLSDNSSNPFNMTNSDIAYTDSPAGPGVLDFPFCTILYTSGDAYTASFTSSSGDNYSTSYGKCYIQVNDNIGTENWLLIPSASNMSDVTMLTANNVSKIRFKLVYVNGATSLSVYDSTNNKQIIYGDSTNTESNPKISNIITLDKNTSFKLTANENIL